MTAGQPIDRLLERLPDATKSANAYKARCPAHYDKNPSLTFRATEDGTVLVKCHAGCSTQAIVAALGLKMSDLFPAQPRGLTPKGIGAHKRRSRSNCTPSYATLDAAIAAAVTKDKWHGSARGGQPGWGGRRDRPRMKDES